MDESIDDYVKRDREKEMIQDKPKVQPLDRKYIPLGEGKGISITVWSNNIQIQRKERDENNKWQTTQEINIAKKIIPELFIVLPLAYEKMSGQK